MADVMILGSTDVTIAVADAIVATGNRVLAIVYVPGDFSISYSKSPVNISRAADIPAWCATHGAVALPYEGIDKLLADCSANSADLCLVAGWYHMVPARVREKFGIGALGFHASLLPQLRGGAPLNWAILNDEHETGVTLFELGDGVDDGLVYAQEIIVIDPKDYIGDLVEKCRQACGQLMLNHLDAILAGKLVGREQAGTPSYGLQRMPADGNIDWTKSAVDISKLIRASSHPYPGAYSHLEGEKILLWRAAIADVPERVYGAPGQIFRMGGQANPFVLTGEGSLLRIEQASNAKGEDVLPLLSKSSHKRFSKS